MRCESKARTGGAGPAAPRKATFYTVDPKRPTVILKRLLDLLSSPLCDVLRKKFTKMFKTCQQFKSKLLCVLV